MALNPRMAAALLLLASGCSESEVAPGELAALPAEPVVQVLEFEAEAGREAVLSFPVRNPGTGSVFLHPVLPDAPFSSDLERLERLAPGEERRIEFRFRPMGGGDFQDEVAVRDSGGGAVIVLLEGRATEPVVCALEVEEVQEQIRRSVDVLVVVDDATATEALADRTLANLGTLPAFFEEQHVDYRLAVVAASTAASCTGGALLGDPAFLHPGLDDVRGLLEERLRVAACAGKGDGFKSVLRALDPETAQSFLRSEAQLLLIFVSARDDGSTRSDGSLESPALYVQSLLGHKKSADRVSALAVVRPPSSTCGGALPAPRYTEAATLLGGAVADLCEGDWELPARWLELPVTGVPDSFAIWHQPLDLDGDVRVTEADLEVRIDGVVVPPRDGEGNRIWDYEPAGRKILFHPGVGPAPGSELRIRYQRACPSGPELTERG